MMHKLKKTLLFLSMAGFLAFTPAYPKIKLQSGNLLFRGATTENISEAIDKVTQTSGATHFSHVGLVETTDAGIMVLHAYPEGGTCIVSLNEFLHPKGDSVNVVAYRLKKDWQNSIPSAIKKPIKCWANLTISAMFCQTLPIIVRSLCIWLLQPTQFLSLSQ